MMSQERLSYEMKLSLTYLVSPTPTIWIMKHYAIKTSDDLPAPARQAVGSQWLFLTSPLYIRHPVNNENEDKPTDAVAFLVKRVVAFSTCLFAVFVGAVFILHAVPFVAHEHLTFVK
jgi:hypothetical protein